MAESKIIQSKVTFIGPESAGKSSIAERLMGNNFNPNQESTIGASFVNITSESTDVKLQCWDAAGKAEYSAMLPMYLRGSNIVYIVLNSNDPQTTPETLKTWIDLAKADASNPKICVAFTKTDELSPQALEKFKQQWSSLPDGVESVHYCSARTKDGIDAIKSGLFDLAKTIDSSEKANAQVTSQKAGQQTTSENDSAQTTSAFIQYAQGFWDRFQNLFGTSNAVRNTVLTTLLAVAGIILVGALAAPLGLGLVTFLTILSVGIAGISAVSAIACGVAAFLNFAQKCQNNGQKILPSLLAEFGEWIKNHKLGFGIGVLLFAAALATIVLAVFFPGILLATFPFLSTAIGFVSSGLAGLGLTLSAPLMAGVATSLIGVGAIAVWDLLCRVGNAIIDAIPSARLPLGTNPTHSTEEDHPPEYEPNVLEGDQPNEAELEENVDPTPHYSKGLDHFLQSNWDAAGVALEESIEQQEETKGEANYLLGRLDEERYKLLENAKAHYQTGASKGSTKAQDALNRLTTHQSPVPSAPKVAKTDEDTSSDSDDDTSSDENTPSPKG